MHGYLRFEIDDLQLFMKSLLLAVLSFSNLPFCSSSCMSAKSRALAAKEILFNGNRHMARLTKK